MNKTLVITGASGGIGKSTAALFLKEGWVVYNLSRHPSGLEKIRDLSADVTDPASLQEAFQKIGTETDGIDLLICNAGFGISGSVEFTALSDAKRQFDVNFFGVLSTIQAALPLLKKKKGRIICTSSAAAVFAIPFQSFYSATKASVNILVSALRNELKMFGVSVTAVQLGDVKTGFTGARKKSSEGDDVYGGAISRSVSVMEHDEQNGMSPETIAGAIFRIAEKKTVKSIYTVGFQYQAAAVLAKLLPANAVNSLVGKIYLPKK